MSPMSRSEACPVIWGAGPSLTDELHWLISGIDHEDEAPDAVDALRDILDRIDEDSSCYPRAVINGARAIAIQLGIFREVGQAELDRTVVSGGGQTRRGTPDFRKNGKMYRFVRWIQ